MLEEERSLEDNVTLAAGPGGGPGGPLDPGPGGPGGPGGFLDADVGVEEEGVNRILVDWGKDFIRLLGSFSPALNFMKNKILEHSICKKARKIFKLISNRGKMFFGFSL